MLALALALQLVAGPAPAVPDLHLVPPLTLSLAAGPGTPDLAPIPSPELNEGAPRPVRLGTVAGAAGGLVVADVVASLPLMIGFLMCLSEITNWERGGSCAGAATTLMIVGAAGLVLLPPAAGVLGARVAGELGQAGGKAYLLGLLVRLAAVGLVVAAPNALGTAVVIGTELVLAPYVIARVLAGAPLPLAAGGVAPAARAVPVGDPTLALARRW